ncbi:glycosyltransferase family protein [Paenibacillus chungangensis]|uniref:Glycosyltransferase n=1 Tax=Paenibacillus chungangensis TaxID=696535 RepID=A0ABW3HLD8_9BACL
MHSNSRRAIINKYVHSKPIEYPTKLSLASKVLIAPHGIGIASLAQALRAGGVYATSCSFYNDAYSYLSDICLNLNQHRMEIRQKIRDAYFEEACTIYDTFHFRFGATFTPDKRDLKILADQGKKLIVHHCGDEVRMLQVARGFNNPYAQRREAWPDERIQHNLKLLTPYIDQVIINDHELLPYVEPYYKKVHIVPYAINAQAITHHYPQPDVAPLVVHASSHRNVKGTEYIVKAVEQLQKEGVRFRFQLIENTPHTQAMQIYQRATIVIDQLTVGTYANLSMEAMAMGKPVICYIRDDLRSTFPAELPIVSANPDTIYEVLRDLLHRPSDWHHLGVCGRKYVEQHHNPDKVANKLIQVYQHL